MSDNETVPPPPLDAENTPRWAIDSKARKEEKNWPDEDKLRGQRNWNDLLWLKAYGILVVVVTIFFTLLFLASLGVWSWHYIMPERWSWLTPEQLSKIQSIIFSGSLGAIVASVLQRQLSK